MAHLYFQPDSHRFGTALIHELENGGWESFCAGVAWVKHSGTQHLMPALRRFLERGGNVQISVGIDIRGTSKEGLEDLLALEQYGSASVFVYHNERGGTFHPKLFIFLRADIACLIVGSNNLTESGLYTNVEAGLELRGSPRDKVMKDAAAALASWSDPTQKLSLRLDASLLKELVDRGYVLAEASIKAAPKATHAGGKGMAPLFGGVPFTPPPVRGGIGSVGGVVPASAGNVLLMRVRKASPTNRPTQTQVPKEVRESFLGRATHVTSGHDGRTHAIIDATARGGVNTRKLEIPEMRTHQEPVLRLEKTPAGVVYLSYDASSKQGQLIYRALQQGFSTGQTQKTRSSQQSATWWRYI